MYPKVKSSETKIRIFDEEVGLLIVPVLWCSWTKVTDRRISTMFNFNLDLTCFVRGDTHSNAHYAKGKTGPALP